MNWGFAPKQESYLLEISSEYQNLSHSITWDNPNDQFILWQELVYKGGYYGFEKYLASYYAAIEEIDDECRYNYDLLLVKIIELKTMTFKELLKFDAFSIATDGHDWDVYMGFSISYSKEPTGNKLHLSWRTEEDNYAYSITMTF